MTTNFRLLILYAVFSVCAASSTAWFAYMVARSSLEESARTNLTLSREQKKRKIEAFYSQLTEHIVFDANSIEKFLKPQTGAEALVPTHLGIRERMIVSCSQNKKDNKQRQQQLLNAMRQICSSHINSPPIYVDFEIENDGVYSYLVAPIKEKSSKVPLTMLMYKIPASAIDSLMLPAENWRQEGFGLTGETYIVGADGFMRTNSRFAIEDMNNLLDSLRKRRVSEKVIEDIKTAHSTVLKLKVDTEATKQAFVGKTSTAALRDYRDAVVLSSFTPLRIPYVNWVLLSEIDLADAMRPVSKLRETLLLCTALIGLIFLLIGSLLSRSISAPLDKLARDALGMAENLQRKIGHDLHDNLAQKIIGIAFLAKAYERESQKDDSNLSKHFARIASLADDASNTARDLARGLSPVPALRSGIFDAIKALAAETQLRFSGVSVDVHLEGELPLFNEEQSLHIYRIIQEAISNAIKHGSASHVSVSISHENELGVLSVANNGKPLPVHDSTKGIGLAIMAMRSRALGGAFAISELKNGWVEVRCQFRHDSRSL